ncbi:uncharacterized protein LOC143027541 [Oratosquilla oratoria]|uniref:uncharacterized protein LOC143027541 n=1 Tax=Oratosquilla oratoria TaxID=337810 RepID=UPI003F76FF22
MVGADRGSGFHRCSSIFVFLFFFLTITTLTFCQGLNTRDDDADDALASQQEVLYVTPEEAKGKCKSPCLRKCCPEGQVFHTDAWTCLTSEASDSGSSPDVVVVPGLPVCTSNFTQTPVLERDGKGRLKFGSYAVSYEAFCMDEIVHQDGSIVLNSLVCDERLGESHVINTIRRTSVVGNILSIVCMAVIFAFHITKPELNKRLGVTFLFFCAAIFFKGIHESFGRMVKFSAYPTYAACVVNSILLMYARASVPVWLNILCMEIARRARFLHRGASYQHKTRQCLATYLLYGLGFPFAQCLTAGILTTLSSNTQKQSSVYDRTCIFTDRDVRNNIFLYPVIAINLLSSVIILYTYRHRAPISSNLSKKSASDGTKKNIGGSDGTVEDFECAEETQREDRALLAGFTSEEFVSEFWQQVGLVCFWVLLTTFMVLVQYVTGRGVLSHITYLMDSFQGVYVFLIFLCNDSKRQIVKYNVKNLVGGMYRRKLWAPRTTGKAQDPANAVTQS